MVVLGVSDHLDCVGSDHLQSSVCVDCELLSVRVNEFLSAVLEPWISSIFRDDCRIVNEMNNRSNQMREFEGRIKVFINSLIDMINVCKISIMYALLLVNIEVWPYSFTPLTV